jgi:type I restriction enzyme S subunit
MMDALAIIPKYQAYKESGVDWLGTIPCGWDIRRIKFIFSEINERSKNGSEELLSVSQYTGVTRKSDKLAENDLLTNAETLEGYKKVIQGELVSNIMLAWNGSLGFSPFDGIVSPAYSVYRLLGENIQRYFHYLLRTEVYKAEYKRRSTGVIESRLRLYTDDFFDIRCLLPPVEEQVVIANFLDQKTAQIDEAIAIKEKQITLLKEQSLKGLIQTYQ